MKGVFVIIPCGQGKIWDREPNSGPTTARDAYTGAPFKVNREYAVHFAEEWVILSAKYGFISPDFIIPGPYNVTFKVQSTKPVHAAIIRDQARKLRLERFDRIVVLGGKEYRALVETALGDQRAKLCFPFAGLPIGKAMQATKQAIAADSPPR